MRKVIFVSVCQYCGQMYGVKVGELSRDGESLLENERVKTYGICEGCMITHHIDTVVNKTVNNLMGKE